MRLQLFNRNGDISYLDVLKIALLSSLFFIPYSLLSSYVSLSITVYLMIINIQFSLLILIIVLHVVTQMISLIQSFVVFIREYNVSIKIEKYVSLVITSETTYIQKVNHKKLSVFRC